MRIKVVKYERSGGRWTVIDHELGYRICNSYQDSKYGDAPSHVHDRFDRVVGPCSAADTDTAFRAMRAYRQRHADLDLNELEKEIETHANPDDED